MTFGTGGDQGAPPSGGFDFMLTTDPERPRSTTEPGTTTATGPGFDFSDRPRRDRRKASRVDSSALVRNLVVVVLAIAVVAAAGLTAYTFVQNAEGQVKTDSAALCADLATTPGVLSEPGFGWPNDSSIGIPASLEAMKAYQARWENLATVGPPTIQQDLAAIAAAATTITTNVESTNVIDRAGNLTAIDSVTSQTAVRAWVAKYCD